MGAVGFKGFKFGVRRVGEAEFYMRDVGTKRCKNCVTRFRPGGLPRINRRGGLSVYWRFK